VFKGISSNALETHYFKTLCKQKEKYNTLIIDVDISLQDLYDPKWVKNYNSIKELHATGVAVSDTSNQYFYNWLYNQKKKTTNCSTYVQELITRNKETNHQKCVEDFVENCKALSAWIGEFGCTPRENPSDPLDSREITLGAFFKNAKNNGTKDSAEACTQEWEKLTATHNTVLRKGNNKKPVEATLPNGDVVRFDTLALCAKHFGVSTYVVTSHLRGKPLGGATLREVRRKRSMNVSHFLLLFLIRMLVTNIWMLSRNVKSHLGWSSSLYMIGCSMYRVIHYRFHSDCKSAKTPLRTTPKITS